MAKFVKGSELNHEIDSLFENALDQLTIVSPFIKLHSRQKDALRSKMKDPKFKLTLVFGKNESNKSRSLGLEDFEFFKQFANVKIYYEPRLHAKYYANDDKGILSSMNLYEYSQNHNIEFGVVTEMKIFTSESVDSDARQYFEKVIDGSTLEYHKKPLYESNMLGLSKKYIGSEVELDVLTSSLSSSKGPKENKSINRPVKKKDIKTTLKTDGSGYCIRSGDSIPFNVNMPYSNKSFQSWNYFKNKDFPEKYCHYSGDSSDGKSSMSNPILSKHWNKAKKEFNL